MATTGNEYVISKVLQGCGANSSASSTGCGWTDAVKLFQAIIIFGIYLASIVVLFVLIKTGFIMITSGSPAELANAKKSMRNVLIGYFFMLCGWLLVKTILGKFGVNSSYQFLA